MSVLQQSSSWSTRASGKQTTQQQVLDNKFVLHLLKTQPMWGPQSGSPPQLQRAQPQYNHSHSRSPCHSYNQRAINRFNLAREWPPLSW